MALRGLNTRPIRKQRNPTALIPPGPPTALVPVLTRPASAKPEALWTFSSRWKGLQESLRPNSAFRSKKIRPSV